MTRLPTDWGEGIWVGSHDMTTCILGGGPYVPIHMTHEVIFHNMKRKVVNLGEFINKSKFKEATCSAVR